MKILLSLMAGTALLTTPAMAANYLIHDQDGHGVTECTWAEAEVVTDWPGLVIPTDATEVRMCVADNDLAGALERMKANRGGGGGAPVVPAPTPTDPEPTEPVDPDPVDPDPVDPTDPTDPGDGGNGDGDGDHDNGHGNDDDGHDEDNPGNGHPDLGDVVDHIKDKLCDRKPHLPFC